MIRMKSVTEMFGVSRKTIYKWMSQGMLSYKVGKLLFFEESEVIEWVKKHAKNK